VFVLLTTPDLPVLRAVEVPVALGVVKNFVLALLLTRGAPPPRAVIPHATSA
jgi:predicted exporter